MLGARSKGVGRKISRGGEGGEATEKRPKNSKKDRKIVLLSLYLLFCTMHENPGGATALPCPLLPTLMACSLTPVYIQ